MKELKTSSRVEYEAIEVAEGVSVKFDKTQNEKGLFVSGVFNKNDREVGRVSLSEESDRMYLQLSPVNNLTKQTVVKLLQQVTESLAELTGVEVPAAGAPEEAADASAAAAAAEEAEPAGETEEQ